MEPSAKRVGVWKMGYLAIGLLLVSLSVVSLAYRSELLTLFFEISGLTLLWEAYKKSALIVSVDGVEFKVIVRGRKPPFEVILLRDGDVVWRGEIRDYLEVEGFTFDIVNGKLLVKIGGGEYTLP